MFFTSEDDPEMAMVSIQRMTAMMAAGEIDVFVLDSFLLEDYSSLGILQPMEAMLEEVRATNPAVFSRIEDRLIFALYGTEEHAEERVMGVNIINCPLFLELGFFEQELFFGVSTTSGKPEAVIHSLITLFE
jgi:hypothetical protein